MTRPGPKTHAAMLVSIIKKEVRQTLRDKRVMFLLIVVPAIQLFVFGHAVNLEVDDVPTIVCDHDDTRSSRTHVERILADGTLREVGREQSVAAAERRMEVGEAAVILVIPPGFEEDLRRTRPTTVQAILDGSDPNRANVAGGAITSYFREQSVAVMRTRLTNAAHARGMAGRMSTVGVESRVLFNPQMKTAIYMVPGVMAMLLLLITTIITAMGIAREREAGTLEQILVTPVSSGIFIAGKILPYAVVGLVDFGLALVVGSTIFDMPLRGHMSLLVFGTLLYVTTTLGVGLLISTLSGSQQQAFLGGFLFMLPAALLSGIMTPIQSMPEELQLFTLLNPLRHYAEILRGSLLRGADWADLAPQLVTLAAMGISVFAFASARFRSSMR